ncbi:phosphatidylinositol-specific phospholipase C domain-containing protein [Planosporangium sp. 12N6]|uniref:phosphatidylinositol-specific phospholipase C domain-containing protein n=1 Tax=Planosporangium spinosum TaxID=3402278 RepID=UPI003CE771D2
MRTRTFLTISGVAATLVAVTLVATTPVGAAAGTARVADDPRQSHTTTVGVHNAYQKTTFPYFADALDSGAGLVELDVWTDSWTRGWRVNHELIGQSNNCTYGGLRTGSRDGGLTECLANLRLWHDAHPGHRPVIVKVEFKNGFDSRVGLGPADFDRLVAARLGDAVYRPADLLGGYRTLDEAALADNWATRSRLAGRFLFEIIPGTFERGNPFDHLWTDTEYASYLRDLAAAGRIGAAQAFPAVLDAAAGDPRTRYPDESIRPWFVFFDGSASAYVGGGIDPAWYDNRHYHLVMTDAAGVAPPIDATRPSEAEAAARVAQLAKAHASTVTADWSALPQVLATVAPRG